MNCQSVTKILPAYSMDDLPSEKELAIKGHLLTCIDCQSRLAHLYSLDHHMRISVERQMERLIPPANAWSRIQSKINSRRPKPVSNHHLVRFAFVIAILILVSLPAIPSVYARLEEFARNWLLISVPSSKTTVTIDNFQAFTPWVPTTLPAGFDLTTSGIHSGPDSEELQLIYAKGPDAFLLVQTNSSGANDLPEGKVVELGSVEGKLYDPAGVIEEPYRTVFTSGVIRSLIWKQGDILIRLYSNMPVEEILKFARSMQPLRQ